MIDESSSVVLFYLGCPRILRADMGTENSLLSVVQPILRHYDSDRLSGKKSFIYGKSICNQVLRMILHVKMITFLHDRELRHYGAKLESNMPNGGFHSLKLVI